MLFKALKKAYSRVNFCSYVRITRYPQQASQRTKGQIREMECTNPVTSESGLPMVRMIG